MQVLPRILPINELKNTANISKICKESDTPIVITKNGYSDMVVMSVELYEQTIAKMQAAILINEALNDPERNKGKVELNSFRGGFPFEIKLPKNNNEEYTNLAMIIESTTGNGKVSEKNKNILNLYSCGQIDYETAVFAIKRNFINE